MKKIIESGMIIMAVLMLCTGCGNKAEKLSDWKFKEIVQAYWDYFTYEFDESIDRNDVVAKIVVHEDGSPLMMVQEYDEVNKLTQNMLYGYEKGKVRLIYQFPVNTLDAIYMDGVVAVISFHETDGRYTKDMIDLYKLDKKMEWIGTIDLASREIEILYRHKKLSLQDEGDEQEYQKFVDDLYKLLYGRSIKPRALDYKCDLFRLSNFFRSAPMAYGAGDGLFFEQDFQNQVNALIKEGGMTQEEFMLWDIAFYADEIAGYENLYVGYGYDDLGDGIHTAYVMDSVLERDASLLDDLDKELLDKEKESLQAHLLYIMLKTRDYDDWIEEVNVLRKFGKDELVNYLVYELRAQAVDWQDETEWDYDVWAWSEIEHKMAAKAKAILSKKSGKRIFETYYLLEEHLPEELERLLDEYNQSES